jgi:hypothetical protein
MVMSDRIGPVCEISLLVTHLSLSQVIADSGSIAVQLPLGVTNYCPFSRIFSKAGPGCRGMELMVCSATRFPTPVRPRKS